jgi:hypothetical protein
LHAPDVFISHASEDKDSFVRPLATKLAELGLIVWYDEFSLRPGDSLRRSIDAGLSRCRHAAVVLSPKFIEKRWTNWELDGLVGRHIEASRSLIIPIWLGISASQIREYSPPLADIVALKADNGVAAIANRILAIVSPKKDVGAPIYSADNAQRALSTLREIICHGLHLSPEDAPHLSVRFVTEQDSEAILVSLASSRPENPSLRFPAKHSVAGWALHRQATLILDSVTNDSVFDRYLVSSQRISSEMCAPIFRTNDQTRAIGVLTMDSEHSHFFGHNQPFFKSLVAIAQMILGPLIEAHVQSAERG